jgi:methionyl-tRNA formyltransferase
MTGRFSVPPLKKLLAAGVEVKAVLTPSPGAAGDPFLRQLPPPPPAPSDLPILDPHLEPNILHLAWSRQIPVWQVADLSDPRTRRLIAELQPDLGVVACFSKILPPALLQLPRYGCLNLHPSLLPAYRGPAPLFWMARNGEQQAGVTLHFLDEGLDTGDIVAQTTVSWPEGISGPALEQRCAEAGADLLLAAVRQLDRERTLARHPQPSTGVSYFPWPPADQLVVPTRWSARRAFNFLRAAHPEWPLTIAAGKERYPIRVVIDYEPDRNLDQPYLLQGTELWVQFQPGIVRVQL